MRALETWPACEAFCIALAGCGGSDATGPGVTPRASVASPAGSVPAVRHGQWVGGVSLRARAQALQGHRTRQLKGVQLVVGGGCPACADPPWSCMVLQQELEKGNGNPLTDDQKEMLTVQANIDPYASMHGCSAKSSTYKSATWRFNGTGPAATRAGPTRTIGAGAPRRCLGSDGGAQSDRRDPGDRALNQSL